ncbi:14 kDa proline-rich protein DC2.15-like [Macadamia integrifolia]|uniref:14 kDa proline-rich protein DC2.15-like n=1 Tax=Macadamia integrifolia TaxID=60698 RepID=UPI001C4EF31D|nr:14 kDa proline-rich protein DC2.15-like [Macadamia integrifolia]
MASKVGSLLIILNLIFFTCVSANCPPVASAPPKTGKCPRDTLKFGVCADVLSLVSVVLGDPPTKPCCALLEGLTNLEAALCLCTAIKANVLGIINLSIPVALTLLVNVCGKEVPEGFQCA